MKKSPTRKQAIEALETLPPSDAVEVLRAFFSRSMPVPRGRLVARWRASKEVRVLKTYEEAGDLLDISPRSVAVSLSASNGVLYRTVDDDVIVLTKEPR